MMTRASRLAGSGISLYVDREEEEGANGVKDESVVDVYPSDLVNKTYYRQGCCMHPKLEKEEGSTW